MVIATNQDVRVGQWIGLTYNPITDEILEPPQPALVLGVASLEDYIEEWRGIEGFDINIKNVKEQLGEARFYNVSTD